VAEIDILAELDEMDCWCGKPHEECADNGGCRWSRQVEYQGNKIGRLRQQVATLGSEVDAAKATIARVQEANDDMRTWCSPYGFVTHCADHIDRALAEPAQQGDQS